MQSLTVEEARAPVRSRLSASCLDRLLGDYAGRDFDFAGSVLQ